ncbi:hypothetical protein [Sphingomonas spermidinifaciens]|uniref:hypothetical protein n=1 Tax=Sphingomonas spermidinifaciens TaxID=1141889 RepID=UPI001FE4AE98|nr:hypothetical protein [Sphingomonas spermidinifaciens]
MSEICCCFSDNSLLPLSESFMQTSDMGKPDLRTQIVQRIAKARPGMVWTPVDFLDLGSRGAVDKVLQRLVKGTTRGASIAASMTGPPSTA